MFGKKVRDSKYPDGAIYYGCCFDDDTTYMVGIIIKEFNKGRISYKDLQFNFIKLGFQLRPIIVNFNNFKSASDVTGLKDRLTSGALLPGDLRGYFLTNSNGENVYVCNDRYMLEVLARYGDIESISTLNSIREKEARLLKLV